MKYTYRYYIQTNNLCYGRCIVSEAYKTRAAAAFWLDCYIYINTGVAISCAAGIMEVNKMYQLNLPGFSPAYYYNATEAMQKYLYVKKYFPRCSLRKISYKKLLSKLYKTK